MRFPSEVRARVRDRRMAAIHEAGHVVIARSFGILCEAELTPTFTTDPRAQKTWVGQTRYPLGSNGKRLKLKPGEQQGDLIEPTQQELRMVGVAGAVAEACWRDRKVYRDVATPEIDWYDPDVMSESD